MQFSRDGEWYQVIRITGPAHNLLALKIGEPGASGPMLDRFSITNEAPTIDGNDVLLQVLEGVAEANAQLGASHEVAAIRFVITDTPSPDIYRSLAKVLVEQVSREGTSPTA